MFAPRTFARQGQPNTEIAQAKHTEFANLALAARSSRISQNPMAAGFPHIA
jgi:hypothetical protein